MGHLRPRYNVKGRLHSQRRKPRSQQIVKGSKVPKEMRSDNEDTMNDVAGVAQPIEMEPQQQHHQPEEGSEQQQQQPEIDDKIPKRINLADYFKPEELENMSRAKRKRFEKYVMKKLKKEERSQIIQDLATSSFSSNLLKSSKTIGNQKETLREQLTRAVRFEKAGLADAGIADTTVLYRQGHDQEEDNINDSDFEARTSFASHFQAAPIGSALKKPSDAPLGSALKTVIMSPPTKKRKVTEDKYAAFRKIGISDDSEELSGSDSEQAKQTNTTGDTPAVIETQPAVSSTSSTRPNVEQKTPTHKVPIEEKEKIPSKPAFYVTPKRSEQIQMSRMELPVVAEEQTIMELINDNLVTVLCGETGSGKTTQVPQFLYEAGYGNQASDNPGMVGITQPRRVAAVSMAKRVAHELGLTHKEVSYQIRYDSTTNDHTAIKFMTDGVLLKEISQDFLLRKYSCIIIDEAHERCLNSDILIGCLSRIIKLRKKLADESKETDEKVYPLRLVIMSATLRVEDFTENKNLFSTPPPVFKVDARQHPVTVHFNRRTPQDYIGEAFKKVTKIHTRLPPGGILVFVSGQNEVSVLCKKLREKFPSRLETKTEVVNETSEVQHSTEDQSCGLMDAAEAADLMDENVAYDVDYDAAMQGSEAGSEDDGEQSEEEEFDYVEEYGEYTPAGEKAPLLVLPLYALLPTAQQLRVFENPPPGVRLCVVATNVAETSLTIPNIRYVVDCGKVKERQYNIANGVSSFDITWTSKASAEQRAGRAGRSGPGHAYRLYSSALFDNYFPKFSKPEIERMPIDGVFLQMKAMNIDTVVNFPFPSPPQRKQLQAAEVLLVRLGALDAKTKKITEIGKVMALFPVAPRYAKMLLMGIRKKCLPYVIALVAALTVGDPFIRDIVHAEKEEQPEMENEMESIENTEDDEKEKRKAMLSNFRRVQQMFVAGTDSDILQLIRAVGAYEYSGGSEEFCRKHFLRLKAMQEIHKLRHQLTNILSSSLVNCTGLSFEAKLKPFSNDQMESIRSVLISGFIDQIAMKSPEQPFRGTSNTVYTPLVSTAVSHDAMFQGSHIFIHPSSCLFTDPPMFIMFQELTKTSRVYMKGLSSIHDPSVLATYGKAMCVFSAPLENPPPRYNPTVDSVTCFMVPTFGDAKVDLKPVEEMYPDSPEKVRYFARFLLEGKVIPGFKEWTDKLVTKPQFMTNKNIPVTQSKIMAFVKPLMDRGVCSKKVLETLWQNEETKTFLLKAFLTWLPAELHDQAKQTWPFNK